MRSYKKKQPNGQAGEPGSGHPQRFRVKQTELRTRPRHSPLNYWINRNYVKNRNEKGGKVLVGLLSPDATDAEIEAFYWETMTMIAKAKQQN